MRDDHLKRHMKLKHNNDSSTQHHGEEPLQYVNIMVDGQNKAHDENKSQAEHCKGEETGDLLVSCGARLKFELQRDDEVYQKNVDIEEQISILLKSENIREKSLSKQNKFCLDLFRAQRPTTDVKNAEL